MVETEGPIYGTGYRPSPPDKRDYPARAFLPVTAGEFPPEYTLPFEAPTLSQGATSMCVDFSFRTIKELQEWFERGTYQAMSNGYIYGRREPDHYHGEGMYPRQALDTLLKQGMPTAEQFSVTGTYEECAAAVNARRDELDAAAEPQKILSYVRCFSPADVQGLLYHKRSPVLLGSIITKAFMWFTRKDGTVLNQPEAAFEENNYQYAGGHAMVIIGWKTIGDKLHWVVQNSWGTDWGLNGRCYLPVDYPGIYELWGITDSKPQGPRIHLPIGKNELHIINPEGTEVIPLDQGATLLNGRTVIPARALVNAIAKVLGRPLPVLLTTTETGYPETVDIVVVDKQ